MMEQDNVLNWSPRSEDLCFFIPDDSSPMSLNYSMNIFKTLMSQRLRSDSEFWMVDASGWSLADSLKSRMDNLELDLDDNVYLYQVDPQLEDIELWEAYRITPVTPLVLNFITAWRPETCWHWPNIWSRRVNLHGAPLRAYSIPVEPYVKELTKLENGTYIYTGIVADVAWHLQVI